MRPTDDQLRRFLAGTLPDDEVEVVERWVESDPAAADVLARFGSVDSLAAALAARWASASPGRASVVPSPGPTYAAPAGYDLFDEVGRGGMGVVFRARDMSLDRDIALKFLHDKFAPHSPTATRFVDEAKITARLQHPGIPAVHEVGTLPDGRPFLAMKLIRGRTLSALLKEQGPGSVRWLGVFEGVCQAVGAAHAAGYIHRDLKPANVMVGAFGEVQVMDWGLAKRVRHTDPGTRNASANPGSTVPSSALDAPPSGDTLPAAEDSSAADTDRTNPYVPAEEADGTKAGTVLGTPSYMAPEQARGQVDRIDRRSDVFALGCILCELLTGKPPLTGNVMQVVGNCAAGKFDEAYSRLNSCGEDAALVTLCKRCLSVEPADRPADGSAVAAAVAAFRGESEARAKTAEVERAAAAVQVAEGRKRQRVWRWATAVVVGVLLAGIAGTTVGLVLTRRAKESAELAEEDTLAAYRAATDEAVGQLIGSRTHLSPQERAYLENTLRRWQTFAARKGEDERSRAIRAEGHARVGSLWDNLGQRDEAVTELQAALAIRQQLVADFPQAESHRFALAQTHLDLGRVLNERGQRTEAEGHTRQALADFDRLAADFPAPAVYRNGAVNSRLNLGVLLTEMGRRKEAETEYRETLALLDGLTSEYSPESVFRRHQSAVHNNLANLLEELRRHSEARPHRRQAVAIQEKLVALFPAAVTYRRELAAYRFNLMFNLVHTQELAEAEREYRHAVAGMQKLIAEFPAVPQYRQDMATGINIYAVTLSDAGNHPAAEKELTRGIALMEQLIKEDSKVPQYYRLLGDLHTNRSRARVSNGSVVSAAKDLTDAAAAQAAALRLDPNATGEYIRKSGAQIAGRGSANQIGPTTPQQRETLPPPRRE